MGSKTTYRMINRKHFGYREGDDEIGLQHTTTPDVIASFWQYKQLFPHLPVFPVDMSFYRHIMRVGVCGGESWGDGRGVYVFEGGEGEARRARRSFQSSSALNSQLLTLSSNWVYFIRMFF